LAWCSLEHHSSPKKKVFFEHSCFERSSFLRPPWRALVFKPEPKTALAGPGVLKNTTLVLTRTGVVQRKRKEKKRKEKKRKEPSSLRNESFSSRRKDNNWCSKEAAAFYKHFSLL
jgi:hypothetical protein